MELKYNSKNHKLYFLKRYDSSHLVHPKESRVLGIQPCQASLFMLLTLKQESQQTSQTEMLVHTDFPPELTNLAFDESK